MRVVIDGWAWLPLEEMEASAVEFMKKKLTITPKKTSDFDKEKPEPIELFSLEREGLIGVPKEFFLGSAKQAHDIVSEESNGFPISLESNISQTGDFEEQGAATEAFLKHIEETGRGGILHAQPAWGKTAFGLELISRLGMTALVVVNRDFLMKQWMKRIEQFLPGAKVGIAQQDTCDYEGKDIVIAMVHSICKREYDQKFYDYFGTVIFDEVHRVPAKTWSAVPPMFSAGVRIGLSATPRRKDGMDWVFRWHIGDIIFKATSNTNTPKLRRIFTGWTLPPKTRDKKLKMPTIIKAMVQNVGRNQQIVEEIRKATKSKAKRKILVLSDRLAHLETLKKMLITDEEGNVLADAPTCDFYVGGRKDEELDKAEEAQVVFASFQMAFEALDISALDVVLFTTPKGDVEQAVGRVQRWCRPDPKDPEKCKRMCSWRCEGCEGKPQPIVCDFMDDDDQCRGRSGARMRFYRKNGLI